MIKNIEKTKKDLQIRLIEIRSAGSTIKFELGKEYLSVLLDEGKKIFTWQPTRDENISFTLKPEVLGVLVFGEARFLLKSACVKCLEPVAHQIAVTFNMRMLPKNDERAEEEKGLSVSLDSDQSLDDAEVNVGFFDGKVIDLNDILREQIFLNAPDYPKCGDGTADLKKVCTADEILDSAEKKEKVFVSLFKNQNI
jgi:uncharacterized metal-binding protein YceD (DUF177 family)